MIPLLLILTLAMFFIFFLMLVMTIMVIMLMWLFTTPIMTKPTAVAVAPRDSFQNTGWRGIPGISATGGPALQNNQAFSGITQSYKYRS